MNHPARARNLETLLAFFAPETRAPGGARLRAALFAEGGVKQVCYPIAADHTGSAPELDARALLSGQPDINCGLDLDCVLWATEDPGVFRAETVERGELDWLGHRGSFRSHCLHTFYMTDGLIQKWQTFPNVFTVYPLLGLEPAEETGPESEGGPGLPPEILELMAANSRRVTQQLHPLLALRDVAPVRAGGGSVRLKAYGDYGEDAGRRENRRAVELYFDKAGREALGISRNDLFTEDGLTEIPMDHMAPLSTQPQAFPTKPGPSTNPADPHWRTDVIRVDPTACPDVFWVETRSYHVDEAPKVPLEGMPAYTARAYWNHYNFYFQLRDGKIFYCRECLDPGLERQLKGFRDPALPEGALDVYKYL